MGADCAFPAQTMAATEQIRPAERLGELFDRYHLRLYHLARRMSRDAEEARDLVQEAFLRAARRPGSIPDAPPGEEAWLVRVLVNLCRDRGRRLAVRLRFPAEPQATAGEDPESVVVARRTVAWALAQLAPRRRAVVVLHDLEEQPVEAVARTLGMSRVTVRWHLSVARKELRQALSEERAAGKEGA
jgi:RNA polymerase sigma-70 factor (ECF subfamily)